MFKKTLSAGLLLVIGALLFAAGVFFQGHSSPHPQQTPMVEEDAWAMHQLLAQSGAWYALHEMTTTDMRFHSVATATARVDWAGGGVWERWGSQDYYLVPIVSEYSNEAGDGLYTIVVGTAYHISGRPTLYEPRLVLYYTSKSGYSIRIDENDQAWRRAGAGQWVLVDDRDSIQRIKEEAKKLFCDLEPKVMFCRTDVPVRLCFPKINLSPNLAPDQGRR